MALSLSNKLENVLFLKNLKRTWATLSGQNVSLFVQETPVGLSTAMYMVNPKQNICQIGVRGVYTRYSPAGGYGGT